MCSSASGKSSSHAQKTMPGGNFRSSVLAEGVYPINLEDWVLTSSTVDVKIKYRSLATLIWRKMTREKTRCNHLSKDICHPS
jgi:hypothetical protein